MTDTNTMTAAPEALQARATLAESANDHVVLAIPSTDYRIRLTVDAQPDNEVGKRIRGLVRAQARRIDVVSTGGRYIEPVYGRPRRIQGTILSVDAAADTVTIAPHDAFPFVCRTSESQRAAQFKPGQFVACDLVTAAAFTPVS
ncbi:MAG: hypothetical protein AB7G17_02295 [Phycisphaerales bacterium]